MRIVRVAIIIATVLFAASRADAAPPVLVNDTSHPSVVTITDAFFTHSTESAAPIDVVCVGFVQNGQKTAKQIGLSLAYVDAQGVVIGVELNFSYGKFGSGLPAGTSTPRYPLDHPFTNGNCHKTFHEGRSVTSSFMYRPRGAAQAVAVAGIVASAREVVYEDGTAFRTDDVPKTGDKLPFAIPPPAAAVPSGGPLYSVSTSITEPFKVLDIVPYGNRGEVCYTLQNGAKNATLARIALVKVGRDGNVLDVEESQTSGRYAAGMAMGNDICTRVKGRDVGVELFVDTDAGRAAIGRVIAVPLHEEFADGSVWD
ncbi:MAG: hypothetical protein M3169_00555, partial [Candidatus Eremiobacteraeota bacterium]|nr:hypothetical protein [Candidatus Eremiobacteraeota bacterium]